MTSAPASRPPLSSALSEQEFLRWYWLKAELEDFAREIDVRATGSKELLTARLGAALAGRVFEEPLPTRRIRGKQLTAPLSRTTVIPKGQRSSQVIRAWMLDQIGPSFHFDASMREFFAESDGTKTMQDAIDHFAASRDQGSKSIDSQFEYNRFTRAWYEKYPDGSREELLTEWRVYRDTPIDQRGRI